MNIKKRKKECGGSKGKKRIKENDMVQIRKGNGI